MTGSALAPVMAGSGMTEAGAGSAGGGAISGLGCSRSAIHWAARRSPSEAEGRSNDASSWIASRHMAPSCLSRLIPGIVNKGGV